MNFTKEEVLDIMYEEGVWEDDTQIFKTVQNNIVYSDSEKAYADHEVVVKEIASGKFYKAKIKTNVWETTVRGEWKEVQEKPKTIMTYE